MAEVSAVSMIERGTQQWREAHRGVITPSDAPAFLARVGTKARARLVDRLVLDVEGHGLHTDEFPEPWAERHEQDLIAALAAFKRARPSDRVVAGGLVVHPAFSWLAASPHALVNDDGTAWLRYRSTLRSLFARRGFLTIANRARVQLELFVTGRAWCDVVDYWNGGGLVPDKLDVFRVERDNEWLQERVFPPLVALWRDVTARKLALSA
jgi:hypothetical protein